MPSRREALRVLAASAIVPALDAQHHHPEELVQVAKPVQAKHLSAEELDLLTRMVDLIIPRTETPGASDAGVPFYIDREMGQSADLEKRIHAGLAALREAHFVGASAEQQTAQLKMLDESADPFFRSIKHLTIDGYYSSKEGLVQELGYHGNTYVREFVGCTHPEHGAETKDAN